MITTYLATHRSRLRQSLLMTLAAALLQGSMAIILVTLTLNLLRLSSRTLHLGQFWLEKASFFLVGSLGLWLCWCALKRLHRLLRAAASQEKAPVILALTPVDYHHHANCGCGGCHLPRGEELRAGALLYFSAVLEMVNGILPFSVSLHDHRHAAVDKQHMTVDEIDGGGGEEHRRADQFLVVSPQRQVASARITRC